MVVQQYIDNPLLMDGLKFDLRVYVILEGHDVSAFICSEGLARFCTEPYEKPTRDNFNKHYMHLTNYSLNKMADNYLEHEGDITHDNKGSKRTF